MYLQFVLCMLNCKMIFLIRKIGFNWIIKGYWYTKSVNHGNGIPHL